MKVRGHDKPSAQYSRFLKMFKQLRLEIGLKDALVEMPKFNKWLSSLLRNKEKLEEIAITTVNAECSAIIMNKVPEKLEDPGKFLIPCALQELDRTSALADSGASINLLPHSIYKKLGLEALTPTRMTLELANRSISHPMGIAEDVVVRVDGFTFLADFVVVNFEPDPRVPIILGRPFLRTAKALIDLYEEKLTLRVGKDELVYYADKSEKNKDKNFESYLLIEKINAFSLSPPIPIFPPIPISPIFCPSSTIPVVDIDLPLEEANVLSFSDDSILRGIESDHDSGEDTTSIDDLPLDDSIEMNDKKVESFERKTKEDFETKVEPEKKKELQVFHPDIEILDHLETNSYVGSDYVFYEDFNLVDMIFPMNIQGKIFDPGITFHEKSFEKFDKSSKELAPSKALLTLDVFDPLHPPLMDFNVTKAFFGFTFSILKIFSKKFVEPGIKNALVYLSSLVWGGFHLLDFLHHCYYPP
ncbi:reverse transcriptase domain-containing protein [Tanacetum coccineum]